MAAKSNGKPISPLPPIDQQDSSPSIEELLKAKATAQNPPPETESKAKKKVARPIPGGSYLDAEEFAREIYRIGSGTKVRRLTAFNDLGKSPASSVGRDLVTNANKYGLLLGNFNSEFLEPTPASHTLFADGTTERGKAKTRVELAILKIEVFQKLYEEYKGKALPAREVMKDFLRDKGVSSDWTTQCVDTFLVNSNDVGLSKFYAGANRLLTFEHMLDELPTGSTAEPVTISQQAAKPLRVSQETEASPQGDFDKICFYISAIGEENSIERKHSDLFFSSIVEPALAESGVKLVRADQIQKAGMITKQILEHIVYSKLVIADLSFHNPNVFYELAIRHACKKPTVLIIQTGESIPFDIGSARTIIIDNTDIYSLVPRIETYRSQIGNQVRKALSDDEETDNPISIFFPGLAITVPQK